MVHRLGGSGGARRHAKKILVNNTLQIPSQCKPSRSGQNAEMLEEALISKLLLYPFALGPSMDQHSSEVASLFTALIFCYYWIWGHYF